MKTAAACLCLHASAWPPRLATALAKSASDCEAGSPCINVQGQSGKFTVCPQGDCETQSLQVEVDFIREIDVSGKKVSQHFKENLASSTFTVLPATVVAMGSPSVDAAKASFSATIGVRTGGSTVDATLGLDTYFFNKTTTIQNGNQTLSVSKDAMKFDINVATWDFADMANRLEVGIKLTSKGASKATEPTLEAGVTNGGKTMDFGNMYFDTPTTAIYDGTEGSCNVSSALSGSKSSVITFTFSSFASDVKYDPLLGGQTGAAGASAGFKALPGLGLLAVACLAGTRATY